MFESLSTKIIVALAATGLLVASFLFGFGVGRSSPPSEEADYALIGEVDQRIRASGISPASRKQLIQGAVRGMLEALGDKYAEYLDPETYKNFQEETSGHFSGVGLWLKQEAGATIVASVLAETPAFDAGVLTGDKINAVDGTLTEKLSLEQVVQKIKGEPGTAVRLRVTRGEQALDFTLTREEIKVPSVESRMIKGQVGLIEIVTFSTGTGSDTKKAVEALTRKGAQGFILDLRGNPGGQVDEAVEVASVFLEGGTVVSFKRRGMPDVGYDATGDFNTQLPLALLVDQGSASSAEIVAAAMQDRGRGIIVGTRTYGKGSVQTVFPLSDGSAVKLTTASYYSPSGRAIGVDGITPDVEVAGADLQLARAQQIVRELLADFPSERAS